MVDLQFMKLPLSGDFSVFMGVFGRSRPGGADGIRRRLAGALPRAPGGAVLHVRPFQVPHEEAQASLARPAAVDGAARKTTIPPQDKVPLSE